MERLKIFAAQVEEEALKQIELISQEENFKNCKIRIMPDVHGGVDVPIGTTIQLNEDTMIAPSLVGVDIGCGISSYGFQTDKIIDFQKLDNHIREHVPLGFNRKNKISKNEEFYRGLVEMLHCKDCEVNGNKVIDVDDALKSLGTLGGGNHYIEIGKAGNVYLLTVHSGSRSVGSRVAGYYMTRAVEVEGSKFKYLNEEDKKSYLDDMKTCTHYARKNRFLILDVVKDYLVKEYDIYVDWLENTVHNYIDENNILRKGSISAQMHEVVVIPINMKDGVIVGVGLGIDDYNYSAPHGAGRIMSRSKARKGLSLDEFKEDMKDVFTTSVSDKTLDESPRAYKKLEDIFPEIEKTVHVIDIYKTIYNIKG